MEQKTGTTRTAPAAPLGWLIAPLAVLLAIAAIKIVGVTFALDVDNLTPMIFIVVASILGLLPSMLEKSDSVDLSKATISLLTLATALIGAEIIYMQGYGALAGLLFALVTFGVHFMTSRGRHELATIIIFMAVGVNLGMVMAGDALAVLPEVFNRASPEEQASFVSTLNLKYQAVGYQFFSYLTLFTLVGALVATFIRGVLTPVGEVGWFGFMNNESTSAFNKKNLPLQIALGVWALAHIGSLWHFDTVSVADKLGITTVEGYHGHFGYWSAFFTGMVALIVAGMFC